MSAELLSAGVQALPVVIPLVQQLLQEAVSSGAMTADEANALWNKSHADWTTAYAGWTAQQASKT